jgi:nucleotide-binding universal stress UspA family protein
MCQAVRRRWSDEAIPLRKDPNPHRIAFVMKTVLAAIDFSPISHAVLRVATALARAIHGRVFLINVVHTPSIATDLAPVVGEVLQFTGEIERGARRHLHQIQKRLAARNATVDTICLQGFPVAQIIAHAKELEAEYIVLGSHGHTAFYDLVAGSTASGVLKRATCPVVVVPAAPAKSKRRKSLRNNPPLRRTMLAPRL